MAFQIRVAVAVAARHVMRADPMVFLNEHQVALVDQEL
jgi:hypothetical protein